MTTLLVRTHGREAYLRRSVESIDLALFDRKILSCDGYWPEAAYDWFHDWEVVSTGPERRGLSANIAQGWSLLKDGEEVFDTEDDFVINELPLDAMRAVLDANPMVAQMVLERQPINPSEWANGGLLGGDNIPTFSEWGNPGSRWREQRHLFSFNPHLRRHDRTVFPVGWGGTETQATERLLPTGRSFGFWGAQGDPPLVEHIGVAGGMGSLGWRP